MHLGLALGGEAADEEADGNRLGEGADADGDAVVVEVGIGAAREETGEGEEVLLGQYLGRGDDRTLVAGEDGGEEGCCCDDGLAAAHVSLEEAAHGLGLLEVGADVSYDPMLGLGEGEGQRVQEGFEVAASRQEGHAEVLALPVPLAPEHG